jgi:hypothetical protein
LLALTLAGLLLRLAASAHTRVIARDGITYLELAEAVARGELAAALASHYPPGYPALLALSGLGGPVSEWGAALLTACAASLVVPAVILLGAAAHGPRAGLFAGALAAVLPLFVELGAEVLADAPHLALVAWTLVCLSRAQEGRRAWAWAPAAACLGGAAYLTRPEALVVLGCGAVGLLALPRPQDVAGWRPRLRALAWLALPALLALLPYLLWIRDEPVLGGEEGAGLLKLTKKQNLPQLLAAVSPALLAQRAFDLGRRTLVTALPLLPFLGALVWLRGDATAGARARSRRLLWPLLLIGGGLALAFVVVRADRRFTAQLTLLALPHAGWGAVLLSQRARKPAPVALAMLATLVALACAPLALRDRRTHKRSFLQAGEVLRELGARRVLGHDSRPAYYGGATPVTPFAWFDPSRPEPEAQELLGWARDEGADALVLAVESDAERQTSLDMAELVGRSPREVRLDGAVPLDVYWLGRPPGGD